MRSIRYSCQILMKFVFYQQILKKTKNKIHENQSSVLHVDRQAARHDQDNDSFLQLGESRIKKNPSLSSCLSILGAKI